MSASHSLKPIQALLVVWLRFIGLEAAEKKCGLRLIAIPGCIYTHISMQYFALRLVISGCNRRTLPFGRRRRASPLRIATTRCLALGLCSGRLQAFRFSPRGSCHYHISEITIPLSPIGNSLKRITILDSIGWTQSGWLSVCIWQLSRVAASAKHGKPESSEYLINYYNIFLCSQNVNLSPLVHPQTWTDAG